MTATKPPCLPLRGWICEEHPDLPWPHDDCAGQGMQCENSDCPWWSGPQPAVLVLDVSYVVRSRVQRPN
jgi:hypothetical protein